MNMNRAVHIARSRGLPTLLILLGGVFCAGVLATVASALTTAFDSDIFSESICLTSSCLQHSYDRFAGTIALAGFFASAAVWIATVGGIVVALLNYLNSTSATLMGNHVSHTRVFYDYLTWEVRRRPTIHKDSVDIFGIYSLIFKGSTSGDMTPSPEYVDKCRLISKVIHDSNAAYSADSDGYKFIKHQERMIAALSEVGVSIAAMPRMDFYRIEEDSLNLISSINTVFCARAKINAFPTRLYI